MLLSALSNLRAGSPDPDILGLTQDSRQVRRGYLFAAMPGSRADGSSFIADAVRNGAVAVLAPTNAKLPPEASGLAVIQSDNPRHDLSLMAAKFYRLQPAHIVAVTGTNGKTSTVHFTQQIWQRQGKKSASLGTLGVRGTGLSRAGSMTTPDPVALHGELADLAASGITHLAMEASSHGLQQSRLDGVRVSAAGFTNLTRDHLDYHATMDDYFQAKARLFTAILQPGGMAVLNADIPEFTALKASCEERGVTVWSYGEKGRELRLIRRKALPQGQDITLEILGREHQLTLPLVGAFQVMNALCALGLVMAEDRTVDPVGALSALQGAPGRLQLVPGHPEKAAIYVDYAHTPDALATILAALRPHTQNRLICLFGCGGDRDPGKRSIMGKIAATDSDLAIITDDNPRSEDPEKIRRAIAEGAGDKAQIIDDRHRAIEKAVAMLEMGDVLVVAGKGHEQGQIFADRVDPFDDVNEVRLAIEHLKRKKT